MNVYSFRGMEPVRININQKIYDVIPFLRSGDREVIVTDLETDCFHPKGFEALYGTINSAYLAKAKLDPKNLLSTINDNEQPLNETKVFYVDGETPKDICTKALLAASEGRSLFLARHPEKDEDITISQNFSHIFKEIPASEVYEKVYRNFKKMVGKPIV